jgi:hypothetical protein
VTPDARRGTNPGRHPYRWGEGRPQTEAERRAVEAAIVRSPSGLVDMQVAAAMERDLARMLGEGEPRGLAPVGRPGDAAEVVRSYLTYVLTSAARQLAGDGWSREALGELIDRALEEPK